VLAREITEDLLRQVDGTEAIDTEDDPRRFGRTRLATANARVTNWSSCARTAPTAARWHKLLYLARICGSPTTIESRLAATRNK